MIEACSSSLLNIKIKLKLFFCRHECLIPKMMADGFVSYFIVTKHAERNAEADDYDDFCPSFQRR